MTRVLIRNQRGPFVPVISGARISFILNRGVIYLSYCCNVEFYAVWRHAAAALLVTWLIVGGLRASEAGSTPAPNARPELVSPYQSYELKLRPFYPIPNRPTGVLVQGRINGGPPLRLVLDSGAEFIVIGSKAARSARIAARSELELVGLGSRPARVGQAETVEIGPVSFRNCRVALMDGKVVEGADGVIPLSFFSDFLVRLNLPAKTLGLIPYPPEQDPAIPSTRRITHRDVLLVVAVLNGKQSGLVVLDTAAFCSAISREVTGTLSGFPIAPEIRIGAGTGATTGQLVSSVVRFQIAGQELIPNEVVALDLSNLSRHYGVDVVGVLGFPALSPYVFTIDYRTGLVKIESARTAVSWERRGDHYSNSPAQLALR